jgi:integrase
VDGVFHEAWGRALSEAEAKGVDLGPILRGYLRDALERDLQKRMDREPGVPVYAHWWEPGDPGTASEADLQAIRNAREGLAHDLARNDPKEMEEAAAALLRKHGLPEHMLRPLALGLVEAAIRAWDTAERRTLGAEPLIFTDDSAPSPSPAAHERGADGERPSLGDAPPARPLASSLVEPFFIHRETIDELSHHDMSQERTTLRLFLDICGDRPINAYGRADVTTFLNTLRRLPTHYGKSPKDKGRSAADIIAEADKKEAKRISDVTAKRHLTALSQFLRFAVDLGHITKTARDDMAGGHKFREAGKARNQRDAWTPEELKALFSSPVWTGCHEHFRTQAGPHVIRDARFWLPLLALYQGARLEELADLYRRDVWCDDGTWAIRVVETEDNAESGDRDLKSEAAERTIPLHPELIRLGFLAHVASTAHRSDDPLFPDLKPQGKDKKRGPRITRWFVEYRKALGLYRPGVSMHAFRHTAITRLSDAATDFQQVRHRDHMMGHASTGGGEGRIRYDKGPGLRAAAETLALLSYPELDFSRLYVGPR